MIIEYLEQLSENERAGCNNECLVEICEPLKIVKTSSSACSRVMALQL